MQLPTVENKLSEFDVRLSRIEGVIEQMNTRLNGVEQGQREILSWIRWLVGIQITTLLTLGTLILFKIG